MARRVGTVTLVRNCENFILPHLNMLKGADKRVVLYLKQPFKPYTQYYPEQPDRALELAKTVKGVEIVETDIDTYGKDVYNAALDACSDCDIVILLHADNFTLDFKKLLNYIRSTDFSCYKLNFPKCVISYYHDFEHGIRDALDHDPMAVSPRGRFESVMTYNSPRTTEIDFLTFHHFVGWKGKASTKEWIDGVIDDDSGRNSIKLREQFGDWTPAPEEIRKMFKVNKKYGLRYEA
ncbi:MAG: hypothetical protein KGL39_15015 [Patescibacteria group bacterium]|nr:hypothetical protein [Patescibacteria group bacterium]